MTHKTVERYLLNLPNTKLEYPFGEEAAVYEVFVPVESSTSQTNGVQGASEQRSETYKGYDERAAELATQQSKVSTDGIASSAGKQDSTVRGGWKMFAIIAEKSDPLRLSLKCDPNLAEHLREKYESVMPGYHLNKKHWNTIVLSGQLPWEDIQALIKHSYNLVAGDKSDMPSIG